MRKSKAKKKRSELRDAIYEFLVRENPYESMVVEIYYTSHRIALNEDVRNVAKDMLNALKKAEEDVKSEIPTQKATTAGH